MKKFAVRPKNINEIMFGINRTAVTMSRIIHNKSVNKGADTVVYNFNKCMLSDFWRTFTLSAPSKRICIIFVITNTNRNKETVSMKLSIIKSGISAHSLNEIYGSIHIEMNSNINFIIPVISLCLVKILSFAKLTSFYFFMNIVHIKIIFK